MEPTTKISEFVEELYVEGCMVASEVLRKMKKDPAWQQTSEQLLSKEFVIDVAFLVSREFVTDMHEYGEMYSGGEYKRLKETTTKFINSLLDKAEELGADIPALREDPISLSSWCNSGLVELASS